MINIHSRFSKATAVALVALQLILPSAAQADIIGDLVGKAVANSVGFKASESSTIAQTAQQQRDIDAAKSIFSNGLLRPVTPDGILLGPGSETLDIHDNDQLQRSFASYQEAKRNIQGKRVITYHDLAEFTATLRPYLTYLEAQARIRTAQDIIIPPGSTVSMQVGSYCLDKYLPAPPLDEGMQLLDAGTLIPQEAKPLYEALLRHRTDDQTAQFVTQNLLWGLREAAEGRPFIQELDASQRDFLDSAIPGGADAYQSYLDNQAAKHRENVQKQQSYQSIASLVGELTGIHLPPPPGPSGYSPSETEQALHQLAKAPVKGDIRQDADYALLAPGVAAKSASEGGMGDMARMTIANSTEQPFTFRPANYIAQGSRSTQRLAIAGFAPDTSAEAQEAARLAGNITADAQRVLSDKTIEGGWKPNKLDFGKLVQSQELQLLLTAAPFVGSGIAAYEAYFGTGFFDGEQLSDAERAIAVASIVPGLGAFGSITKVGKGIVITEKGLQHAIERHTYSGIEKFKNKSKFNSDVNIKELISTSEFVKPAIQSNGYISRTFDAGKKIGIDRTTGKQTSVVTVITNTDGELITAYPGNP